MTESSTAAHATPAASTEVADDSEGAAEDARTQRRRLAAVWLGAGSALAAMVGVSWYVVVGHGGAAPGGDMIGHAAATQWLRTLPWWDWRGWSDWFYGGQAIGVNYPPLGHAWMRFTHPTHGQMAAVALGLLVFLPWGALRLARAAGCAPRAQRAAVAAVLVLAAASGNMHWVLSGFHSESTFFSSWPAMLATVSGLFAAAWAARCRKPVACGVVVGVAVLLNATVVPGVAVVCAVLLATSGASFGRAVRWAATAGSAALAVCAWWLVPFLSGSARLVRWEVPLAAVWSTGGVWQAAILATLGVAAAWAARRGAGPSRRLVVAAAAGLLATLSADLLGYLRSERWLELPILVAAVAVAGLFAAESRRGSLRPARPAWIVLSVAFLIVFVVVTLRLEMLPLAVWLLWRPRRTWAWGGALAWFAVLLWVPFWGQIRNPAPPEPLSMAPLEAAAAHGGPDVAGLVYLDNRYNTASGDVRVCMWGNPWLTTTETDGRIRPLAGMYQETSATAEFLDAEAEMHSGAFEGWGGRRPHWFDAWHAAGEPSLDSPARAEALGARWYTACDADGNTLVTELSAVTASGVTVAPHPSEEAWHRAAVAWWVSLAPGILEVPVLLPGGVNDGAYPTDQAARGVSLQAEQDSLTLRAEAAGWVWLRVPWDPDWRSVGDTPVHKGGPGHLVIWADQGVTELRWSVPRAVDGAAVAATGAALVSTAALAAVNRRRGWQIDPDRHRPGTGAVRVFADIVDGWAHIVVRTVRRIVSRAR